MKVDEKYKIGDDPKIDKLALYGVPVSEEIIRCRDCKYARRLADGKVEWCALNHDIDGFCREVDANGFCSWAERGYDGEAPITPQQERYQKLASVAKEMLGWFQDMRDIFSGEKRYEDIKPPKTYQYFKEQLEALEICSDD